ncbi:MAG: hypothetical protein Q8P70_00425 [bacterium]|nr:hypothetical protein [bacterium]
MKNAPLTIGIVSLIIALIGVVFSQFFTFWIWFFVILGIGMIVWVIVNPKNKDTTKG